MMGRSAFFVLVPFAAALLAAVPTARAQCRLCEAPATGPKSDPDSPPMELEVQAILDFDRIVVLGGGEGTATLRPDGTRHVTGSVEAISGRAMVGEARVRGEPGRTVRVDMPSRIELHSVSGATISIDEIVTDLPPMPRLDSSGGLSFRFGGRLRLSGNSDGDFRGDLPITVEYL
jgi:hypothetical protein